MAARRHICIFSDYFAWPHVFNVLPYEFVNVLSEVEAATIIAPPPLGLSRRRDKICHKLHWAASRSFGIARPPRAMSAQLESPCDIFVFVGAIMDTLGELKALKRWRDGPTLKIAYIIEAWSATIERQKPYLELLKAFDHIFTAHSATAPLIARATGVPCHYLPPATDIAEAVPGPQRHPRTLDVLSIGRRLDSAHQVFLSMARAGALQYEFDTIRVSDTPVLDWSEHRFLTFDRIRRSRFFTSYDHRTAAGDKAWEARGEQVVPARIFEGTACGAVVIGSAPKCAEFNALFHWPDAVIELPPSPSDLPGFIKDLSRQTDRLAAVRRRNVWESVGAHDWVHRWATILDTVGLEQAPGVRKRLARLSALAEKTA